jgi:hypothetical protein
MSQLDEVASHMERRWGVDRLPRLVHADLAERFYSQLDKVNAALEVGSPADIQYHAERMKNAWQALNDVAEAKGALPLSPKSVEARLPDGRLLVICDDPEGHRKVAQENRAAVVWDMEEIVRVLWAQELVNVAKAHFPGAEVTDCRPTPDKAKPNWKKGDDLPDFMAAG